MVVCVHILCKLRSIDFEEKKCFRKADISKTDQQNKTPLMVALERGHMEVVR